jgi:hypothetical protein
MKRTSGKLVWAWMIFLVLFNVIPLGNGANKSLSSNSFLQFRLDYLLHTMMILVFSWIWVFGRIRQMRFFPGIERLKYLSIVWGAGFGLELLQLLVPWRSFNPVDMYYNLLGAGISTLVVCWSRI